MDLNPSVVEGAVCLTVDAAWEFAVDDDGGCGELDSAVGGWMMKLHIPIVDQRIGTSDRRASPAYVQRVPKQASSTQSYLRRQASKGGPSACTSSI
jgi:hypothetical protein